MRNLLLMGKNYTTFSIFIVAIIVVTLTSVSLGFFTLWAVTGNDIIQKLLHTSNQGKTSNRSNFKYLNPELLVPGATKKYVPFELKTTSRIFEEVEKKYPNTTLSVYVRNLNNGPWFGIHEDIQFAPIALLKMPLFIAYLKWSEEEKDLLDKSLVLKKNTSSGDEYFTPKNTLQEGKKYTILELLNEMMINSNNYATITLRDYMPKNYLIKIESDLGIDPPNDTHDLKKTITLKEYSTFFRILYDAGYLSPESSELALSILTKTDFKQGIVRGVPENVQVANKFWERVILDNSWKEIHQIHDCGIVYYTKYPYIVCILSKWTDLEWGANAIWDASKIIYEEISKSYP